MTGGEIRPMNEDNYFKDHPVESVARKYVQMNVFIEALNEVLELDEKTTFEQLGYRIRDLSLASTFNLKTLAKEAMEEQSDDL